jgi:hypothetical protein
VDEGLPIAYTVVEKGVPVLAADGTEVGTVHHVVAAPEEDIFHGVVIVAAGHGLRFVEAERVASLHEHGVDLAIAPEEVGELPEPGGGAPVYVEDPSETKWEHLARRLSFRRDRDWRERR